jgi:N-acetyl-anhydromuramyl-L-alanine amidase AmpD
MNISREYTAKNLGNGTRTIVGIVLHDTAGSGKINDVKYLANPGDGRNVSVDFCVTRDGGVYQLSPDLKKHWCFHAGRATKFKDLRNSQVNRGTIGIEIVQKADLSLRPLYPAVQVQAVAELCAYLCTTFKLKKEDITTHAKIITDRSRSDPRQFPFTDFFDYFNPASNAQPTTHTVVAGDTLYSLAKRNNTTIEAIKRLNGMNDPSNTITIGQKLIVKA